MKRPATMEPDEPFPALSKRAARRLIQRAVVLAGRDRSVRQHLREAELTTLWVLEDWRFEWTVVLWHGKLEFHRGKTRRPQLTYRWRTAADFFGQVEDGRAVQDGFECEGEAEVGKFVAPVFEAFCAAVRAVLENPIDDDGERLV